MREYYLYDQSYHFWYRIDSQNLVYYWMNMRYNQTKDDDLKIHGSLG